MSKQRAHTRAERAAAHQELLAKRAAEQARAQARRRRVQRRQLLWRRVRLWQNGPAQRRNAERWAALTVGVLSAMLVTYLVTRSWRDVLVVALVCAVASPLLIAVVVDRRRS